MDGSRRSDHHPHHGGGDDRGDAESYLRRIKAEIRKTNKPIMEKKRRARINNYLNDLKALLLDAMKKDPIRHSKLEKADILDLTVKHLQDMERRKLAVAMAVDPTVVDKFKTGFNECIDEIDKYLGTVQGVDSGMKQRISNHLKSYLRYQRFPHSGLVGAVSGSGGGNPFGALFGRVGPDEINNNGRLATMEGLSLIPSLLPSGELAFIMPHNGAGGLSFLPRLPTGAPPVSSGNHFKPIPQEGKSTYAPSPPLSPVSDQDSLKDVRTPVTKPPPTTTLTTKIRPALMESLLSAFPTPPTPEESSRISAFRPNLKLIDRIRIREEETKEAMERESKRRRVELVEKDDEDDDDFSDDDDEDDHEAEGDAKENSGGDMWRPW